MNVWHRILDKCLSGRFIVLVMVAFTYCSVINASIYLAMTDKLDMEFVKGLIAGLASNLIVLWKEYSTRTDRFNKKEEQDVKSIS